LESTSNPADCDYEAEGYEQFFSFLTPPLDTWSGNIWNAVCEGTGYPVLNFQVDAGFQASECSTYGENDASIGPLRPIRLAVDTELSDPKFTFSETVFCTNEVADLVVGVVYEDTGELYYGDGAITAYIPVGGGSIGGLPCSGNPCTIQYTASASSDIDNIWVIYTNDTTYGQKSAVIYSEVTPTYCEYLKLRILNSITELAVSSAKVWADTSGPKYTGLDGRVLITRLANADVNITVSASGYTSTIWEVDQTELSGAEIDLRLPPTTAPGEGTGTRTLDYTLNVTRPDDVSDVTVCLLNSEIIVDNISNGGNFIN